MIPGSGRSPGEGNGHPLQYSCLENPMGRGAWRATVQGVQELDTTERLNHHGHHGLSPLLSPPCLPQTALLPVRLGQQEWRAACWDLIFTFLPLVILNLIAQSFIHTKGMLLCNFLCYYYSFHFLRGVLADMN